MGGLPQVLVEAQGGSPQSPILSVKNLGVRFRGAKNVIDAVSDVSFDVFESEILSIVGESGSGKTTIARCLAKLLEPTSGSIVYRGRDVTSIHGEELKRYRKEVQIVFQDPFESLNPRHDVLTAVSAPIRYLLKETNQSRVYELASEVVDEVGLNPSEVLTRYPHQLSGGQRQRVSIARALASNPTLLVADEPITMLDAAQRLNVLSLLWRLKKTRGISVIMITHDLASARLLSDRTAVLFRGKMFEYGPTEEVVTNSLHPYTDLIIHAAPGTKADVQGIADKVRQEAYQRPAQGCIFRPLCVRATDVCGKAEPEFKEALPGHAVSCYHPTNQAV